MGEPKLIPEQPKGGPHQTVRHLSLCTPVSAAVVHPDSLCVSLCCGPGAEEPSSVYFLPASSG